MVCVQTDMLRKLCLLGLVVLFDRGSVVQVMVTLCISIAFFTWQVRAWPYKIDLVRPCPRRFVVYLYPSVDV